MKKSNSRLLVILFLMFILFGGVAIFAFWASGILNPNHGEFDGRLRIGHGEEVVTELSINGTDAVGNLIPYSIYKISTDEDGVPFVDFLISITWAEDMSFDIELANGVGGLLTAAISQMLIEPILVTDEIVGLDREPRLITNDEFDVNGIEALFVFKVLTANEYFVSTETNDLLRRAAYQAVVDTEGFSDGFVNFNEITISQEMLLGGQDFEFTLRVAMNMPNAATLAERIDLYNTISQSFMTFTLVFNLEVEDLGIVQPIH